MKEQLPILFLQAVIVLVGAAVLIFMLVEPRFEGRNVNATFFEIYFKDLFLAYVYLGSLPFFVALYQACKVLRFIGQGELLSGGTVVALNKIKYCAFITAGAIVAAGAYLAVAARGNGEDAAGALMLCIIATFVSATAGAIAIVFERALREARHSEE